MTDMQGRRALISGASGFVGSHLAVDLLRRGWEVHTLRRGPASTPTAPWHVHAVGESTGEIVRLVSEVRPDVVFHLASLFLATHQPDHVTPLVTANVLFGTQLLEAARVSGCGCLVNAGTSWQHFRDEDYNPVCLYAATKQAFADILRYYTEATGLRAVTLSLLDTYGPGDPRPKIFRLLRQAVREGAVLELSPGDQLVDLVYIDDVIDAFRQAAELLITGRDGIPNEFAVRSGRPLPLREVVATWMRVTGATPRLLWGGRPYRPREVMIPWSRGATLPGWSARVSLEEGIRLMETPEAEAPFHRQGGS